MKEGPIHQEDITTTIYIFIYLTTKSQNIRSKNWQKWELDNLTIIVGDFNTSLSIIEQLGRRLTGNRVEQYKPVNPDRHL